MTNATGAVTDSYEYDAFGNALVTTGSTPNVYLYRGEQYDADLGLYYLRARYYNPATGRFMGRDPFTGVKNIPVTLHKYLYAGGNPVNFVDPRGREEELEYGSRMSAAEFTTRYIAAIGCGAGIGFYVAQATVDGDGLWNGMKEYPAIPTAVAASCVLAFFPSSIEGVPSMSVNIVGAVGCYAGIKQTIQDYNRFTKDLSSGADDTADLTSFETDSFSSVIGCGATALGTINDFGGYYDNE